MKSVRKIVSNIEILKQILPMMFMLLVLFSLSCEVGAQDDFSKLNNSKDWKLQFSDPCIEDWQENWFLDGELATITHSEKGMDFNAGPVNRNDAHHAVLWTKGIL